MKNETEDQSCVGGWEVTQEKRKHKEKKIDDSSPNEEVKQMKDKR